MNGIKLLEMFKFLKKNGISETYEYNIIKK